MNLPKCLLRLGLASLSTYIDSDAKLLMGHLAWFTPKGAVNPPRDLLSRAARFKAYEA